MNKKKIILSILILLMFIGLIIVVIKKNSEMLIQGEVDTKTVDLSSKIAGRVKHIDVQKGDIVKKGQVLITLDTPDIAAKYDQSDAAVSLAKAKQLEVDNGARIEQKEMALSALNQAKATLELSEKTYNRLRRLNAQGVVATQKLDEASAQYKNAQKAVSIANENWQMYKTGSRYEDKLLASADVQRARSAQREAKSYLDENIIKSPISGQVTEISVEEGELVGAGYTIITVVSLDDNWVVFNLREDLLSKIRTGSVFDVQIPAIGKKPIDVRVNYISAMGNFATWRATRVRGDFDLKTFEVHAKPVEKIDGLRAGMTAIVDWNKVGSKKVLNHQKHS